MDILLILSQIFTTHLNYLYQLLDKTLVFFARQRSDLVSVLVRFAAILNEIIKYAIVW